MSGSAVVDDLATPTPTGAHRAFAPRSGSTPEGHERLTREAAARLAIAPGGMRALLEGVRRPDTESLRTHLAPTQQRRHALRASLCQPTRAALADIRAHIAALHRQAVAAGPSVGGYQLAGEALHTIQDSFSPAHIERGHGGGRGPVVYIHFYGLTTAAPIEHQFPFDPRDLVAGTPGGPLRPWARAAVEASRAYLELLTRAWRVRAGSSGTDPRAYLAAHLGLAPEHQEPSRYHIACSADRQ